MKLKRGSTSVRRLIFIGDSSSTTGAGLTGLVYNSSGLTAYYFAGDGSSATEITLATATLGTYTSGGFKEVDATNMPGWYEIGIPNAALDGGNEVAIAFKGATDMVPVNIYIELDAVDYQTASFGALQPTTAGRTLDVTSGGCAGIDWANVESQTTSVGLTGTTVDAVKIGGSTTAATNLATSAGVMYPCSVDTVVNTHTPTTTEFQSDTITEATTDHYVGRRIIFTSGVLTGQGTAISGYSQVGGIGQFTVVAMTEAPSNDDQFIIV